MSIRRDSNALPRADLGEVFGEFNPTTEGFIAREVLPGRETRERAAEITVIKRENAGRANVDHANGAAFNRVSMATGNIPYAATERALEGQVTSEDVALAMSEYDAEAETTTDVTRKVLVEREIDVKDLVLNTSTWTGAALYTDNSGSPWATTSTDILSQVNAAKEKVRINTGYVPNTMIMGQVPMNHLLVNDDIIARFPGSPIITEMMIRAQLAAIFGMENLLVGKQVYNSANEGQDYVGADIWGETYVQVCRLNTGSLRSGGLGRTLIWTGMDSLGESAVESYDEPQTDSTVVRVREYTHEIIFDEFFAHMMKIKA